ncbi:MAG: GntR family transcriptional regulator [Anaerolineaceae bacterium]|nr:GntR family transcriptional regulator [Anaerolineaceae bacterium]
METPIRNTFYQLQNELGILLASLTPGDRLPSEPELAKKMGVSRATLREAMRKFEGQGLIRRRQGVGTFLVGNPQVMETGLEVLQSIENIAGKSDLDVSMGALNITRKQADTEFAESLKIIVGSEVVQVERVIHVKSRPVAYLIDVLPADVLSETDLNEGFTGSVLDFLLKRGVPALSNSYTEIGSVPAPTNVAKCLEIQRGDVLTFFKALLYDDVGNIVDYSMSYFIPGYFRFHVVRRVEALL